MHARVVADQGTALRLVYGPCAAKKLARSYGVSVATAKAWLAGRLALRREDRLTRLLEDMARHRAELERVEAWINELRGSGSPGR